MILCFTTEVCPRLRSSLAKTSAYSLKICLTSCWSMGVPFSMHHKRSTLSSTSCSKVGSPSSNCGDIGVCQVNSFWGALSREAGWPMMGSVWMHWRKDLTCVFRGLHIGDHLSRHAHYWITVLGGILTSHGQINSPTSFLPFSQPGHGRFPCKC